MPYNNNMPKAIHGLSEKEIIQGITDGYLQRSSPSGRVKMTPRGEKSGFYEAKAQPKKKKKSNDDMKIG